MSSSENLLSVKLSTQIAQHKNCLIHYGHIWYCFNSFTNGLSRNDRYDDLRVCLGEGLLQKLKEQRIFMVSSKVDMNAVSIPGP